MLEVAVGLEPPTGDGVQMLDACALDECVLSLPLHLLDGPAPPLHSQLAIAIPVSCPSSVRHTLTIVSAVVGTLLRLELERCSHFRGGM